MKKRVILQKINYLYALGELFDKGFLIVILGGMLALFFYPIAYLISILFSFLSTITIQIFMIIGIGIGIFVFIILGIFDYLNSLKNQKISNYIASISNAYRWSIREALRTEYPEGVIYIVENSLKELEKFGISNQPHKVSYSNNNGISDVKGFPNQTNLKAAIYQAENLSQEWGQLNNIERINAMKEIWRIIEKEDMWLDWTVMRVNLGKEIYWYSYDESDHQAMIQHPSNVISAGQASDKLPSSTQPVFNSQTVTQSDEKILSFDEFLQKNPELFYHSEREQREEYYKYLASMGVNPRSSRTASSYQKDNVRDES